MNLLMRLSARHLRLNKKRTAITIIGIALSIAMVTAISGFIISVQDMLYRDSVVKGGLWHVRYMGITSETASLIASEEVFSDYEIIEDEHGFTVRLLMESLGRDIYDKAEAVRQKYGIEETQISYHTNLLIAKGIVPGNYYEALYSMGGVLLTLVCVASVIVISNAFAISSAERSRQFGILKSVGATSKQIRAAVLYEGLILAVYAVPLGFLAGLFTEWVALSIANSILGSMSSVTLQVEFRVVASWGMLLTALAVAMVVIFLASWRPARRASRQSAIEAIRQTSAIKIRPNDVRVSHVASKLFGFEWLLAAKTMKRSRGRYRTTVLSLVVSIVLFIGVSSFGELLFKASSMVYGDTVSNVLIQLNGENKSLQDEIIAEMSAWDGVEIFTSRKTNGAISIPEDKLTEQAAELFGLGESTIVLYSISDSGFDALCRSLRQDPEAYRDTSDPKAILVNTAGIYIMQGRRYSFTPYNYVAGDRIEARVGEEAVSIAIAGITEEIPKDIDSQFYGGALNLIVSEQVRLSLQPGGGSGILNIAVMAEDADAFEQRAGELLASRMGDDTYFLMNYEEQAANSRNIGMLVMVFVYGFVALLTLIGVTNLITTISTGIALRRREFAMLRSLGMTQKALNKTLRYESMICGFKSLVIGIPLGFVASVLMYNAMDLAMSFEYIWPVQSAVISVIAVMVLVFCTMFFAASKQRRENIVSALQDEVI